MRMDHRFLKSVGILRNCATCGRTCYPDTETAMLAVKQIRKDHKIKLEVVGCLDTKDIPGYAQWKIHVGLPGEEAARVAKRKMAFKSHHGYSPPQGKNKTNPKKYKWIEPKERPCISQGSLSLSD